MPSPTDAYDVINGQIAPDVLALFRMKQSEHVTGQHFLMLGAKGQFAELNKKFWKLYAAIWTGETELVTESVDEVAADMIGHLLLLLFCLRRDTPESPLPRAHPDAQVEGPERLLHDAGVRSGDRTGRPPEDFGTPPRCLSCADCESKSPIWCRAWGAPNEYALQNMDTQQVDRMLRMFGEALQ